MLYNVAFAVDSITDKKKAILNQVSDYEIYSYYLGHAFQIGKVFSSPFREDKRPSFNIYKDRFYHGLLHKDFGDARYVGDCFSFVEQRFGYSHKDAINRVQTDLFTGRLKRYLSFQERKPNEKTTKVRCLIQYEPQYKISKEAKTYWEEIGLTEEWRAFFKILGAKKLYVDETEWWYSTDTNPIFVYKIFDKIKGYRPLEEAKSRKWISNASRYDIQGWEQLPEINDTETIIITKSLKDVAVLRTLGYLAVAPSAESVMVPPIAMRLLKEKYGIKKFIILFDRDHAGMVGAKKMFAAYRGTYNITFKFIGRGLSKDVADFRRTYGEASIKRYLLYLLNYEPNAKLSVLSTNGS
jgi:DNA primase